MEMEWVRVTRDLYGQTSVAGAAWDPLILFVVAGFGFVVLHALYKAVRGGGGARRRSAVSE